MEVLVYDPAQHFPLLERSSQDRPELSALAHRPLVDWYYGSCSDRCRLLLAVHEDQVQGALGFEVLDFELSGGDQFQLAFGSNFHSFRPGLGGLLFLRWIRACRGGVVFGGSADIHEIVRAQGWMTIDDVHQWVLNAPDNWAHDQLWKRLARSARSALRRVDLRRFSSHKDCAHCEARLLDDCGAGVSPNHTEFTWRFRPAVAARQWRYPKVGPVRYKTYQIRCGGEESGFVVLSWRPNKIAVAHVDVARRRDYVPAVLRSLGMLAEENPEIRYAPVVLTAQRSELDGQLRHAGLIRVGKRRFFAIGGAGRPFLPAVPTTGGSFSFGIGDNDLRAPFWTS